MHNFAANPWIGSNLSERSSDGGGVPNAATVIKLREDQGLACTAEIVFSGWSVGSCNREVQAFAWLTCMCW